MMEDMDDDFDDVEDEPLYQDRPEPANWWDLLRTLIVIVANMLGALANGIAALGTLATTRSVAYDNKKRFEREALSDIETITGERNG